MSPLLPSDFQTDRYGLHVRLAVPSDAEFVVRLRTDPKLSRHLHQVQADVEGQRKWLESYKERERRGEELYFVFEKPAGTPLGLCRIYGIEADRFTVGSWIFDPASPAGAAILADLITRELAYELMPGKTLFFDVRKDNITVLRYQATFRPTQVGEDEDNIYYTQDPVLFERQKQLHLRMFAPKR